MNSEQFESAKKVFFILLGIDIAATAIVGINAFSTAGTLRDIQAGTRNFDQSFISSLEFWESFSKLLFLTLIGVGVGLVKWLNGCYNFAKQTIGATGFKNDNWTLWGWIVPFFNLFKPYQVISEIYKVGSPSYAGPEDWKRERGSGALLAWWIFWLVSHLVGLAMTKQILLRHAQSLSNDLTMAQVIGLSEMQAWLCMISLTTGGLWFWVANLLTQRLLARNAVSASSLPPQYGYQAPAVRPASTNSTVTTTPVFAAPSVQPSSGAAKAEAPPSVSAQNFTVDEDAIYAAIANELESGATDKGLWTRLYAECDGDENRTKVAYIKHRAARLMAAEQALYEEQERLLNEASNVNKAPDVDIQTPLFVDCRPDTVISEKKGTDEIDEANYTVWLGFAVMMLVVLLVFAITFNR